MEKPKSKFRDQIPEGAFFSDDPRSIETLSANEADDYISFFQEVIKDSPHYTDEEKEGFLKTRMPQAIFEKVSSPEWIFLVIRDDGNRNIIASQEAQLLNMGGQLVGNIKWTLVHPNFRKQGLATILKKQLENVLRDKGAVGIITSIKNNNIASIEMNRKLGIVRDDSFPPPTPDAAWYTKRLDKDNS